MLSACSIRRPSLEGNWRVQYILSFTSYRKSFPALISCIWFPKSFQDMISRIDFLYNFPREKSFPLPNPSPGVHREGGGGGGDPPPPSSKTVHAPTEPKTSFLYKKKTFLPQTCNFLPQTCHFLPQTCHSLPQTFHFLSQTYNFLPQTCHF